MHSLRVATVRYLFLKIFSLSLKKDGRVGIAVREFECTDIYCLLFQKTNIRLPNTFYNSELCHPRCVV